MPSGFQFYLTIRPPSLYHMEDGKKSKTIKHSFCKFFGFEAFIEQKENDNDDIYLKSMFAFTLLRR